MVPLVDVQSKPAVNPEDVAELFDSARRKIVELIDLGLEGPLGVLQEFNKYAFLFTKSSSYILKRLFGESKDKPNITNIDVAVVEEKLRFYRKTQIEIEELCIDERPFLFFLLRTRQAKLTMVARALDIQN